MLCICVIQIGTSDTLKCSGGSSTKVIKATFENTQSK